MHLDENARLENRIEEIRKHIESRGKFNSITVVGLAKSVLYDTVGGNHPLMDVLDHALKSDRWSDAFAASRSVVTLFEQGGLRSPRLAIAHEIEGDLLDIARVQVESSEKNTDDTQKQLQLAIAAFLAGAALEDALRRLCDARGIDYNQQRTSISTLQAALYQPAKQIEIISGSENKQITAWGETRNNADHGRFSEITYAEVLAMVIGVQGFIDKHLP